jgi:hypothetical protein
MLRLVLRLLGVDLDYKLAEIRAQIEGFRARTIHQLSEQVKEAGLTVGFAFAGAVAAIATFVIVLMALYRWVDLYKGPFVALTAAGVVMGLLAAVMFVLACWRRPRKPAAARVDRGPAAAPLLPVPPPRPASAALSAAPPHLPSNASVFDALTHRFSTRVVGAGDEAIDAAVHLMRTGSKSVLFGTLGVVALIGVIIGRRQ